MWLRTVALLATLLCHLAGGAVDPDHLRCLVCRSTIDEFESALSKLDPKKTMEVGNYKLDQSGNMYQTKVPLSKSQVHLSEMLDDLCKKLSDYVRVRYKATGKLAVFKMLTETGGMNPEFGMTDFVTDDDLNKSLEFYCEGIIGENEDNLIDLYVKREGNTLPDGKQLFCTDHMKLCQDWMLPNDDDRNWSPDKEKRRGADPYGFGGMNNANNPFQDEGEEDEGPVEQLEDDTGEMEIQREEL